MFERKELKTSSSELSDLEDSELHSEKFELNMNAVPRPGRVTLFPTSFDNAKIGSGDRPFVLGEEEDK